MKPDVILNEEDKAVTIAEQDIAIAYNLKNNDGNVHDFALHLRHKGYKKVDDFRLIKN